MEIKKPVLLTVSLVSLILFLYLSKSYLSLFLTALIIAYFTQPVFKFLKKIINEKNIAAFFTEMIFLILLIYLMTFVVNNIYSQIVSAGSTVIGRTFVNSTEEFMDFVVRSAENPFTRQGLGNFWNLVKDILISTPEILLNIFVLIFFTFFLIRDYENYIQKIKDRIPSKQKKSFINFFERVDNMTREIIFGHFLSALIIGLLTFVLLNLIGSSNSLDYAVFSAITSLIPIIGSWIVPIILSLNYWFDSKYVFSIVFVIYAILISFMVRLIQPIINSEKEKIHPMFFVLGLAVGFYSFGLFGFFIGPIFFGVLQIGIEELVNR